MEIKIIAQDKKAFLDLLLLGGEQESMVDRYLERAELFALYDDELKSVCAVTKEAPGVYEIKSIATYEQHQGQGYGRKLIEHIFTYYQKHLKTMLVGIGDSPATLGFYQSLKFSEAYRIKDYFLESYDKPIFADGKQLIDMIYLKRQLK